MNPKDISFVFFGTPKFGTIVLDELEKAGFTPKLIVAQEDKPQGRHLVITPPETKVWALKRGVGVYQPKNKNTDATQMLFHWDYVNERMKVEMPGRENEVGWYIVQVSDPSKSAQISSQVDALFKNSPNETKTETERAFTQGFVSASGAIITAMNVMSWAIVGIILLVLGNTMVMAARERTREYAVLKTLGFSAKHLVGLIFGESMFISCLGGGIGLLLTFPIVAGFAQVIPKGFFPDFEVETVTIVLSVGAALFIGVIASIFPIQRAIGTKIVDGFRFVG